MRCGCPQCDAYMIQSESLCISCVCPDCGYRCSACMGTNTVVQRDELKRWAADQTCLAHSAPEPILGEESSKDPHIAGG